jgi:hypothetical protein
MLEGFTWCDILIQPFTLLEPYDMQGAPALAHSAKMWGRGPCTMQAPGDSTVLAVSEHLEGLLQNMLCTGSLVRC